jgi:dephospho-CoA kinase
MKILGLCGNMGAGKDYVFDVIKEYSSFEVIRVAFADGVRDEVAEVFNLSVEQYNDAFRKPYSDGVRFVLQQWGTEFRRAQDDLYWVKRGIQRAYEIEGVYAEGLLVVFTDVRFANEAYAINEVGGKVIRVEAPTEVRNARLEGRDAPDHASEVIDFPYDSVIDNGRDGEEPRFWSHDAGWLGLSQWNVVQSVGSTK